MQPDSNCKLVQKSCSQGPGPRELKPIGPIQDESSPNAEVKTQKTKYAKICKRTEFEHISPLVVFHRLCFGVAYSIAEGLTDLTFSFGPHFSPTSFPLPLAPFFAATKTYFLFRLSCCKTPSTPTSLTFGHGTDKLILPRVTFRNSEKNHRTPCCTPPTTFSSAQS